MINDYFHQIFNTIYQFFLELNNNNIQVNIYLDKQGKEDYEGKFKEEKYKKMFKIKQIND